MSGAGRGRIAARRRAPGLAILALLVLAGCRDDAPAPASTPAPRPAEPVAVAEAPRSPNLVLITVDTLRADALGVYGQALPTSPNIDRAAREGVLFEQATTTNPETLAAHASILTGRWPFGHGVRANAGYVLSERHETLAETLRERGYRTGVEIASLVLRQDTQIAQGFSEYRGAESPGVEFKKLRYRGVEGETETATRTGADITKRGLEFIRRHRDEPFFLWLHYFDPHNPYSPPPEFNARIPASPYHAEVASADHQIGRVLREIERLGLRDRTLVALTSDHGEGLGEHGEATHSYYVYDSTMRVPLILWGLEGLPRGQRIASLVRTVDIAPTALDLLGAPGLSDAEGRSLRPLLEGERSDLELRAYGEATRFLPTFGIPAIRTLREGSWKYIHKVEPELYDLGADPGERENLADVRPERALELRAALEAMLRAAPDQPDDSQAALDAATARQLVALGYVAKSPAFALEDEIAALELEGPDPNTRAADTEQLAIATGYLGRGDHESALPLLERLTSRNPEAAYLLGQHGIALLGLGRTEEAARLLRRAIEIEPSNIEVAHQLAMAYEKQGELDAAIRVLEAALPQEPCDARLVAELPRLQNARARHGDAVALLAETSARCPELDLVANNYAWALATLPEDSLRDGQRAVEVMQALIARQREPNPAYLDTLAAALAESGRFEEAVVTQERAIALLRQAGVPQEVLSVFRDHLAKYRQREPLRHAPGAGS